MATLLLNDVIFIIKQTSLHFGGVIRFFVVNYLTSDIRKNLSNKIIEGVERKREPISKADSLGLIDAVFFFKEKAVERVLAIVIFVFVYNLNKKPFTFP